ncbi:MAG: citrate lyase acyl carrier protein [Deltaproteobacteria bacterium]|jgi:citrate lyase subunit gamma (acyl carrier protein)|nr:citrate lyase acyl carrier protein [Deltaproteobacteria bacterium]
MKTVLRAAQAGTMESNDLMVIVEPGSGGISIDLESIVSRQYGAAIRATIARVAAEMGLTDLNVKAVDKGALDYAVEARTRTALGRALAPETDGGRGK